MGRALLLGLAAGIFIYLALSIAWGASGIQAHRELEAHRARLEENIQRLEERGAELRAHAERLRDDKETLRLAARRLGYFEQNERQLLVENSVRPPESTSPGALVAPHQPPEGNRPLLRAIALAVAVLVFGITGVGDERLGERIAGGESTRGRRRTEEAQTRLRRQWSSWIGRC